MKTQILLVVSVLVCALFTGCLKSSLAQFEEKLKDDHATIDHDFQGWGVSSHFHRSNPLVNTNAAK